MKILKKIALFTQFLEKGGATVIAAACVLFLAGAFPEDAYAENSDPVSYIDENGNTASTNDYTLPDNNYDSNLQCYKWSGTVVVKENVEINTAQVRLFGETRLILCDGATLTVSMGNNTALDGSQNKLTVYGQERNSGKLILTSDHNNNMGFCLRDVDYSQIGGKVEIIQKGQGQAVANTQYNSMEIKGGELNVNAPNGYGCINLPKLTISGGLVKIKSKNQAIKVADMIDISGGELYANSDGADGSFCVFADGVKVTGGTVSVNGAEGGVYCSDGDFTVSGGNVTIKNAGARQDGVHAIGGVNISGGTVNIESEGINSNGIFIYAHNYTYGKDIPVNISGGTVNIKSEGEYSCGIIANKGNGCKVPVNITSGNVTISAAGENAKGIWNCDDIKIGWTKGTDRIKISSSYSEGHMDFAGTFMTEDGALIDATKEEVTIGNKTYYRYPGIEGKPLIPAYKVRFFDGDTEISEKPTGIGQTVDKPADPVKEGKDFLGWYSDKELTKEYDFNSPVTADLSLYAKFSADTKVPVTDPSAVYPSENDNFAPIARGSSNGTGGSIKDLTLDFSKVAESGVKPDDLKMTAVNGSKLTTAAKVKDQNSVKTTGGVKAKYNKKDGTVTFTCKKDGTATVTMADGNTYTIKFTVQKPKAQKSAKKMSKGGSQSIKTVHDLFGTDINAGKLDILKQKHSQAKVSDNNLYVDPKEKDSIKLQYKYLNKKYKMTVKVK